jgi:hypothetical protein
LEVGRALGAGAGPKPNGAVFGLGADKSVLEPGVPAALTDEMGSRPGPNGGRLGAGVFARSSFGLVDGCGGKDETEEVSEASPGSTDGPGVGSGAPEVCPSTGAESVDGGGRGSGGSITALVVLVAELAGSVDMCLVLSAVSFTGFGGGSGPRRTGGAGVEVLGAGVGGSPEAGPGSGLPSIEERETGRPVSIFGSAARYATNLVLVNERLSPCTCLTK